MNTDFKEGYIICHDSIKKQILFEIAKSNEFKSYKFLTLDDLKRKLTFSVYNRAIIELSRHFNINSYVARAYINTLYQLNGSFDSPNGLMLKEIYSYLYDNNLIIEDNLFKSKINDYHYTFIDADDTLEVSYIKSFINDSNITMINRNKEINKKALSYYSFASHEEELGYVFSKIHDLIKNGVLLNDIKLCNLSDNYSFMINRIANNYNIPLENNYGNNVLCSTEGNKFIDILSNSCDFTDVYSKIKEFKNQDIANSIIKAINDYEAYLYNPSEVTELFKMVLKDIKYDSVKYDNEIEIIRPEDIYYHKDKYIFLLNFNVDVPKVLKDEDFLSDIEKKSLNMDQTAVFNRINKEKMIDNIYQAKKLTITYSSNQTFDSNTVSPLVKILEMKEIRVNFDDYIFGKNKINDDIYLSKALDNLLKFGQRNKALESYYYNEIDYNKYNYKFKGIKGYNPDSIKLSYSSLKEYYECPFRYYLSNILKLNSFENTIESVLGTYAHGILQDYEEQGLSFNLDEASNKWFEKANLDFDNNLKIAIGAKEKFYFEQMKKNISLVIGYIKSHKENSSLVNSLCEKKMNIEFDDGKLIFKGFVDKILYDDNKEFVAIVDYKTGSDEASLDNIEYGSNLQLPIYIYFLKNNDEFKNSELVGFYLKKINIIIPKFEYSKTALEQKLNNLRLKGFTNDLYIDMIDKTRGDFLANYKLKKDNTPDKNSKIFNKEDEEYIYNLVDRLIKEAYEQIKNARFDITYKLIDGSQFSCSFCKYSDICYKSDDDIIYLKSKLFKDKGKEK